MLLNNTKHQNNRQPPIYSAFKKYSSEQKIYQNFIVYNWNVFKFEV
jgi:hypothetical protein